MARRKKEKLVINTAELSKTTLGTIKNQKSSFLPLIFVFAIFLTAVFFMPEISLYVEKYLNPTTPPGGGYIEPGNNNNPVDNEPVVEIVKNPYTAGMSITSEKFEIRNINIIDNKLSFTIANISGNYLNFKNYNFFLEFYTGDTFNNRRLIDKISLKKDETKDFVYDFLYLDTTHIVLREIPTTDYPIVNVEVDENNRGQLTCIKGNETYTYYAENNEIYNISQTISVALGDENYFNYFQEYQALVNSYNAKSGFTAQINMVEAGLNFALYVDLVQADLSSVENNYLYKNKTNLNIVNFEMEAQGFTCS